MHEHFLLLRLERRTDVEGAPIFEHEYLLGVLCGLK
jgi:hypothetical protein